MLDVVIIGAGVIGCAIARELSRYELRTLVLEKHSDVCEGTSKANSGIVHAGYDAKPGTLKARMNILGNRKMDELARELDFPFRRIGSLVLCFHEAGIPELERLLEQGRKNGVPDLEILGRQELRRIEPNVSPNAVAALYAPTGGIVCPFLLTIGLAENAYENGVSFSLGTEVAGIERLSGGTGGYRVRTNKGDFEARAIVNAAGASSGFFHNLFGRSRLEIVPRKGEYCLMDKAVSGIVSHVLFQLPTVYGKGVLVTPTVHGNLLVGPTAVDIQDGEATETTAEGIADVLRRGALSVKELPTRQIITQFTGVRAHEAGGDFVLGEADGAPGFFDAAGIESPGLTCAPAIGTYLAERVAGYCFAGGETRKKENFRAQRKGIPCFAEAGAEERARLIAENPLYGNVICRCETVTEGEIVEAIRRPLGATTLDGVKRRTRAGMGRCQAGFCSPKVADILARELGVDLAEIRKNDAGSELLTGYLKEGIK